MAPLRLLPVRWSRVTRPPEAMRPGRVRAIRTGIQVKLSRRWLRPWGVALVDRPAGMFG